MHKKPDLKTDLKTDFKRVIELMGAHKARYIAYSAFSSACAAMMSVGMANSVRHLVDFFIYKDSSVVPNIIIWLFVSVVIGSMLNPFFIYRQNEETERIMRDIRIRCFDVLQDLPVSYFERTHSGDTFTAINQAIDTSMEAIEFLGGMFENITSILVITPYIISLDLRFGAIAVLIGIISSVFNTKVRFPMRERIRAVWENYENMVDILIESVIGFNVLKMFGLKKSLAEKSEAYMDSLFTAQKRHTRISAFLFGTNAFMGWFNNAFLSAMGCWLVLSGALSEGVLVASVMVSSNLTWGIIRFGESLTNLQNAFTGTEMLYNLFSEEKEPLRYETDGTEDCGNVVFHDIKFGYSPDCPVLHVINFRAKEGGTIALVGSSGGGKSTIIKLVMGLYRADGGKITILGKPLKEYTLEELRNMIAYVPQDAYIFNTTIKENILIGNYSASDDEVIEAARKANAHDFIIRQPDGYDTVVGERGVKLSGGQKQRIAIARAILKNAPILLLDEATSSLDNESETLIQDSLEKLMKEKTCIVVAHRLSTIENADMIYCIRQGKIAEHGTHQQLMAKKGMYHELYTRNFV
jgi:ATP-binding cassette subfamily B protein